MESFAFIHNVSFHRYFGNNNPRIVLQVSSLFLPADVIPDGKSWPGFGQMHSLPRLKNWYNQYRSDDDDDDEPAASLDDNEIAAGGAFQRRTPHAVINVLRAEQLEAAEGRRSTGELYERNIRVLMGREGIGLEKLAEDLRLEQQR